MSAYATMSREMENENQDQWIEAHRAAYIHREKRKLQEEILSYPLDLVTKAQLKVTGQKDFLKTNIFGLALMANILKKSTGSN
jgi:hypothetical protein